MPRHILTPEERARGHKLTDADRRKGGRNVPKATRGGTPRPEHIANLIAMGARYRLTSERAKELALKSAQVRRERRAQALITLALDKAPEVPEPRKPPCDCGADTERGEEHTQSCVRWAQRAATLPPKPVTVLALAHPKERKSGAFREVDELLDDPTARYADGECRGDERPPDPFTLSALKRFRLGPMSPFQLTRSQRKQMHLLIDQGFVEWYPKSDLYRLTEKGRQAVDAEGSEVSDG